MTAAVHSPLMQANSSEWMKYLTPYIDLVIHLNVLASDLNINVIVHDLLYYQWHTQKQIANFRHRSGTYNQNSQANGEQPLFFSRTFGKQLCLAHYMGPCHQTRNCTQTTCSLEAALTSQMPHRLLWEGVWGSQLQKSMLLF